MNFSVTRQFVYLAPNYIKMKRNITLAFLFSASAVFAQPKLVSQAIISTKTTIISPEEDENNPPPPTGGNGEEMRIMRFGGEGETKTTTWLKSDLVKTYLESDMGKTTIIRDNGKKLTTTIMEIMGRKTGFYVTDSDQVTMRKKMDSMMQGRRQNEGISNTPPKVDLVYADETKKISGFDCHKALLVTTRSNGKKDSSVLWYTPDIKFQNITNTGGSLAGFGGFSQQAAGMDLMNNLKGFPIQYERNLNRGRKMTVLVTKIITDTEIADKEFEIPKGIEIKSIKEMPGMMGGQGMMQMRIGG